MQTWQHPVSLQPRALMLADIKSIPNRFAIYFKSFPDRFQIETMSISDLHQTDPSPQETVPLPLRNFITEG